MFGLMRVIGGFMDWWKKLVPIPTTTVFGKPIVWSVISFPIFLMLVAIFFFKGGLLDYWSILW